MKKIFFMFILILAVCLCAFAQNEKKMAASLGVEWNMNTREMFAGGLVLSFDYNLPVSAAPLALGLAVSGNYNFDDTMIIEFVTFFRWYFLGKGHKGWFAQAEIGYSLIKEEGNDNLPLPISAGLRAGYRFPLGSLFFVEPFGRLGYSYLFGVGVTGGLRF